METVVALFGTEEDAQAAVDRLEELGYGEDRVGYLAASGEGSAEDAEPDDVARESAEGALGGAAGGAIAGAGAGLLASAGLLVVPGIGPLLAGGVLATTLAGAGAGALGGAAVGGAAGAVWSAMHDEDDERVGTYRRGVEEGGVLITLEVPEGFGAQLAGEMRSRGAVAVDVHTERGWMADV